MSITGSAERTERPARELLALVRGVLEDGKAGDTVVIDLTGKTSIADFMVIATGRSQRQIGALSENLVKAIKDGGFGVPGVEGRAQADWVLVDAGDVIVHLFRPEVRAFYNLEKMWAVDLPGEGKGAAVGG